MQVRPERLQAQLTKDGPRCYLVFGPEPLQAVESVDAIRNTARANPACERLVFDPSSANWSELRALTGNLSLFATNRLIEIRLGAKKPDKTGAETLTALIGAIDRLDTWLITAGELDRAQQNTAWFKACDQHGVVVNCRDLDRAAFNAWLAARSARAKLDISSEALEFLSDRTEGNLLAAAQELDKLQLLVTTPTVSLGDMMAAISDSARYDVYQCVDTALVGDQSRVVRIVRGLHEEGSEPLILGWTLNRELRVLTRVAAALACGRSMEAALAEHNVWASRQSLIRRAVQRHKVAEFAAMLEASSRIDQLIKGYGVGEVWDELEALLLRLAGAPWLGRARAA